MYMVLTGLARLYVSVCGEWGIYDVIFDELKMDIIYSERINSSYTQVNMVVTKDTRMDTMKMFLG